MVESYERYILSKREKAGFAAGLLLFFSALGYVFYASLFPVILLPVIYKKAETVYCRYLAAKRKMCC